MAKKKLKTNIPLILNDDVRRTIIGIFLCGLSVLILLSLFNNAGFAGGLINAALGSLFGYVKFLSPLSFLAMGIMLLHNMSKDDIHGLKVISFIFALFLTASLVHMVQYPLADDSFKAAQAGIGGGFVGYAISAGFLRLLGFWGGVVSIITLIIIALLIGFNISFNLPKIYVWFTSFLSFKPAEKDEDYGLDSSEVSQSSSSPSLPQSSLITSNKVIPQPSYQEPEEIDEEEELELVSPPSEDGVIAPLPDMGPYKTPTINLLDRGSDKEQAKSGDINKNIEVIKATLKNFGMEVEMGEVNVGPTVTQYMLRPSNGIKLSRITALQNDLALALSAESIRIEAPIPGKPFVGIELPNLKKAIVRVRDMIDSPEFKRNEYQLPLALGRDVNNQIIMYPLEKMPHLLIAGATGAGKSMGLNSMIISLLYKNPPSKLKFVFIDPKRVELSTYNGIPHLLVPAIVNPDKAMNALMWCVTEMERRYEMLAEFGSRNIFSFNEKIAKGGVMYQDENGLEQEREELPFIVIIIDELADLMTTHKKEVEGAIVRIAQMARAVGIHLVLATQRPSIDVITGLIKANLPSRVSFQVASQIDSRTIIDMAGAEKLLGQGDMLFLGGDLAKPKRIQGAYISEKEVKRVVDFLTKQSGADYQMGILESELPKTFHKLTPGEMEGNGEDVLFDQAKELVISSGKASSSLLQRRFKIGYARAARLLDSLEEAGIVGPADGSKPRDVMG